MNNKQKLELIWEGKYDERGKRVAPLRVALPFQTVETINEATQQRQKNLLLENASGSPLYACAGSSYCRIDVSLG